MRPSWIGREGNGRGRGAREGSERQDRKRRRRRSRGKKTIAPDETRHLDLAFVERQAETIADAAAIRTQMRRLRTSPHGMAVRLGAITGALTNGPQAAELCQL